jgi:hypothetical protein
MLYIGTSIEKEKSYLLYNNINRIARRSILNASNVDEYRIALIKAV